MDRLTKLEIQRALLGGREVGWKNGAGKREAIELKSAGQRRLFQYLLQAKVRQAKDIPDEFVSGLAEAFAAESDPAENEAATAPTAPTGPWRMHKIETEGFGGLNTSNGPPFVQEIDGESLILQGPNGSGKSSLVGAILWALTGERPRDHSDANPSERAEVYGDDDRQIGTWPPLACYPNTPAGLSADPFVSVALTFKDNAGVTAHVRRQLKDGVVTSSISPALAVPDVLIETGLLMPTRMPQIRFAKGPTQLTKAVQSLTGLDELVELGAFVDGLCNKGREYLSTNSKLHAAQKQVFDAAIADVLRVLKPTGETVPAFQPKATDDKDGDFAKLGARLKERAAELTKVISEDLVSGLDLAKQQTQLDVAGAISGAREDITGGLAELSTWKTLSQIATAFNDDTSAILQTTVREAEDALADALKLHDRSQQDTRLQLKALGAQWHQSHRGAAELTDCPLCDEPLREATLKAELDELRRAGESATRQLSDNLNAILAKLDEAVPPALAGKLVNVASLTPRQALLADLRTRFVERPRFKNTLATFTQLVTDVLAQAPANELELLATATENTDPARVLRARISAVRRLEEVRRWRAENAPLWEAWWLDAVGSAQTETEREAEAERTPPRPETFSEHLTRLSNAVSETEPYRAAAEALGRAWTSGRKARTYEKEQEKRQAIADNLAPLKALGALSEAQTRLAIDSLSGDIAEILKRLHLTETLGFKGANLERKAGLQVRGGFVEDFKIDATLVANTSWLRSVLWAFLFALRQEAVKQLGGDSLPLLALDDPQATFDVEHRHRWAQEILRLQKSTPSAQIILVTHDEIFLELIRVDGVEGREGIIVSAGPELKQVGIFEGASLDRRWARCQAEKTSIAAQDYIGAVRIYVEGLLRLMLRGHAADVSWATHGFVMGAARDKIRELHSNKLAPWDKTEFKRLIGQLDIGIPAIKYMEMAHHSGRVNLHMGEAETVEVHWRKELAQALRRAFQLARDHQLIHGGLRALHAAEPDCALPEGYSAKVKSLRLHMLGRAAALTGGRVADGRFELDMSAGVQNPLVLGRHLAFRLNAPTLEPVARKGDVLLVKQVGEPSERSLVIARCEDRVVARRFEVADNHSDLAVLTAQSVSPRQIASPIVVKRATLELHKVVGVLFDFGPSNPGQEGEVCDCGGESVIGRYAAEIKGLVEVMGDSAEPIALDGQMLMIGTPVSASDALAQLDGRPVIASNMAGERYFKRLRRAENDTVVLESLEISGDFAPVVLTHNTGAATDLKEVWPVHGVLFERP
ncbi:AAA family ATPase [Bosea sp. 117]|uniref:AAA family ATPase n=1 Tax=Bosea sp. 117 TaxID=1125973 RepID=UPI000494376B|nr:AAA family ATPase [Bosea sp. 117]